MRKKIARAKKFREGGRVRAGNASITPATRTASRARNAKLDTDMADAEIDARQTALSERATGGRYQDPPRPHRANAGLPDVSDEEAGNPRGVSLLSNMLGRGYNNSVRGEQVYPGGDNSIGVARAKAYGRADAAAMEADTDREVRRRFSSETAYKRGGVVKGRKKK